MTVAPDLPPDDGDDHYAGEPEDWDGATTGALSADDVALDNEDTGSNGVSDES